MECGDLVAALKSGDQSPHSIPIFNPL